MVLEVPENCVLYLARHATPDRSRSDVSYNLPPGPDLTEAGKEQAAALGAFFLSAGVKHILSSPFTRALSTARIAGEVSGAFIEVNPDLKEWGLDELEKSVAERMRCAFNVASGISADTGPVALISHGSPVMSLLKDLGMDSSSLEKHRIYDGRNPLPMAGAWEVRRSILRLAYLPETVSSI